MALTGADMAKLQNNITLNRNVSDIPTEQQALMYANLKPYNRADRIVLVIIILGVLGCFALFASQYNWDKNRQEIVKVSAWWKLGMILLGGVITAVNVARFV
ncbi:hypothetical protein [Nguyenibacter sp. L1]|uniref:hypothetical protein n=1 Tax=Nguyenibacter sp. L1 TaxID=3049350 RepID=UPI002B45BE79|nr:hypothetical protein [Nguyenibacter sp. L1]WRH89392.1 hypothetical protein QN315_07300 [Nguyenibacter sp. L1]